ncbi:hypothetical protein DPM13_12980 [Paracoccus mutanolyticus]|uniref:Uncharacterized protein n=1 Tax=Paracoccus mutanolyticus TaxID=1499308 RepID=A0ABM6WSI6_9RHOB|nr:hypothetical protein DPM13_12980 [Paracoccus mutanolyticus]
MEMALMGDGVPADQVYEALATPEGLDRAFAKLDTSSGQGRAAIRRQALTIRCVVPYARRDLGQLTYNGRTIHS